MNNQLKAIILTAFSITIALCIELLAYLTYPNNTLDKVHNIIKEDRDRFWKVRENFDTIFWGQNVKTDRDGYRVHEFDNKTHKKIKIATMGASPSFGWGVSNNQTYTSMLNQIPEIESKNFSQIGYSSFQGTKILNDVISWKPNIVFISYIINDLDYLRFFYNNGLPDISVKTDSDLVIKTREFLNSLYSYKWLRKVATSASSGSKIIHPPLTERVSIEDFRNNYLDIIDSLIEKKIIPVIIKFPVNLPETANGKELSIEIALNQKILKRKNEYYAVLDEIASLRSIEMIDLTEVVRNSEEYLFLDPHGDTIHPNPLGHKLFFEYIVKNYKFEI